MIFLTLGSSIGNAAEIFDSAEKSLGSRGIKVIHKSKIFKNPPYGGVAKNEFSNAVWHIETEMSPEEVLEIVQQIERDHGRTRERKWDDRTLDIDILLWNDLVIKTPKLTIPHPGIAERIFFLKPLSELVDENFQIPTFGTLKKLLSQHEN